ncbi:class I SAM-dependent methyltransferase [Campylobacter sp.]|uniref:class I SAM-dependent methyltransferase n=1 Tax=Campylobacter sp. TaxID=205 RepID=UPI002705417C|nr:class I SAM-dependent methyltransferase [Campylobacter sp.]
MLNFITKKFSKPEGRFSTLFLNLMNKGHKKAEIWALSKIDLKDDMCVLDVGCGGGLNLKNIAAKLKSGQIFGVDYSKDCVEYCKKLNQDAVRKGKMQILEASVENLPFEEAKFDLITAFETIYFWPDLRQNLKEVNRVLKPAGSFYIFTELALEEKNKIWEKWVPNMRVYTSSELFDMLREAGFSNTENIAHENGRWNLYIGFK